MASNVNIKDASGATVPISTDDVGSGVEVQNVKLNRGAAGTSTPVTSLDGLPIGNTANNAATTVTRPADTNAYAANDLVANNTTAGNVTYPSFTLPRDATGGGSIRRARVVTNHTTGLGGVSFRIYVFSAQPTSGAGDNAAWSITAGGNYYIGSLVGTFVQFGDYAVAICTPSEGNEISMRLASGSTLYCLMQTLSAFTPQSGKTFTTTFEILQD